ncbi:MAG: hypothetical protein AABY15_02935 [Nanoarchaeota archaeon]
MTDKLKEALDSDLWKNHKLGDEYIMDGKPAPWKIAYYPLFGTYNNVKGRDGEIIEVRWEEFVEPRALVEKPAVFDGEPGTDFREVPLRYLTKSISDKKHFLESVV